MEEIDTVKINRAFNEAKSKLIFLDLDGTLSPINVQLSPIFLTDRIREILLTLSLNPNTQVIIISGRSRDDLDRTFGELPLVVVAEHGGFFKEHRGRWIARFPASVLWKFRVLQSVHELNCQYSGSVVEEKYYSICWHYGFIKGGISEVEIQRILSTLHLIPNENEFAIHNEKSTIDIRSVGIDKGRFAGQWIWGQRPFDFILAMGDSKTDEDLFEAVGLDYFTIKIGNKNKSSARYCISDQKNVEFFLNDLIKPLS
jgi:trehalose 6-phosphate synthase/phosphatase